MRKANLELTFKLFLIVLLIGFTFSLAQESKDSTRIVITTSGPAKFNSYWLDNPPRLVVEFQTRNIISKIDNEVIVNQGVIKRITSRYFEKEKDRSLKSLTFELLEKVPYKIWQELDTIILDIQAPQNVPVSLKDEREIFTKGETKDAIIKRLEAMNSALKQAVVNQSPSEDPKLMVELPQGRRKSTVSTTFWFIGLALISGLGLLFWLFWRRYRLILDKNRATQEIEKLKSQVAERNKLLEQEEIIRKTIENTSLLKEKEFEQLQLELQKEAKLLEQEEKARKAVEEGLVQKGKEYEQLKSSFNSLKDVLLEKGLVKELTSPEEKGMLWIPGKSPERRSFARLDLSRDYNRTIILRIDGSTTRTINPERSRRIESEDKSKSIKSFANNIGLGGLCFETRKGFVESQIINLRLFFFGDKVPTMKIGAKVIWQKAVPPVNYCGISFIRIEEKDKTELNRYIESKITRGV